MLITYFQLLFKQMIFKFLFSDSNNITSIISLAYEALTLPATLD